MSFEGERIKMAVRDGKKEKKRGLKEGEGLFSTEAKLMADGLRERVE